MIVAVIGSRTFTDYNLLKSTLETIYISKIVSGGDLGADQLAEKYAEEKNIPVQVIPHTDNPTFSTTDRSLSIINKSQLVVAFWDGKSQGTLDLTKYAQKINKRLKMVCFRSENHS